MRWIPLLLLVVTSAALPSVDADEAHEATGACEAPGPAPKAPLGPACASVVRGALTIVCGTTCKASAVGESSATLHALAARVDVLGTIGGYVLVSHVGGSSGATQCFARGGRDLACTFEPLELQFPLPAGSCAEVVVATSARWRYAVVGDVDSSLMSTYSSRAQTTAVPVCRDTAGAVTIG